MECHIWKLMVSMALLVHLPFATPLPAFSPEEINSLEQDEPLKPAKPNLEATIKEVEGLIKSNPKLPRLTRGEILDILDNITSLERAPKTLMVVMPYTPDSSQNMEALYTKPPVTHIIGSEPVEPTTQKHTRRRPPVSYTETSHDKNAIRRRKTTPKPDLEPITTYRPKMAPTTYRPRWEMATYQPRKEDGSTTRRPSRRRTTTTNPPEVKNHRFPNKIVPNDGIRIIESPKLERPKNDLSADYDTRREVVLKVDLPITNSPIQIKDIPLPDRFKTVVESMNLEGALNPSTQSPAEQKQIKEMLTEIGVFTTTSTSTTTSSPNAENVADSLSPEMKDLLMSFGLLPNSATPGPAEKTAYMPDQADVKPESYLGFKPLPDDGQSRDDMDALLASFGLGRSARREKKVGEEKLNLDMIPDDLRAVVHDLGIEGASREAKKIRSSNVEKMVEKQHVFSPDEQYASDDELKKLDKLIGMIRQLEQLNGTATDEDLKKIDVESLKELVASFNNGDGGRHQLAAGPDPNDFDGGLIKNEVKRQESTTMAASTEAVTDKGPNAADLEASFGGQSEVTSSAPPVRKSGFYYLVDWNTFLDIDDTKGKRVNLRFQPTIGDPKRFYSVSVP